jgi:hypothetical protein
MSTCGSRSMRAASTACTVDGIWMAVERVGRAFDHDHRVVQRGECDTLGPVLRGACDTPKPHQAVAQAAPRAPATETHEWGRHLNHDQSPL